MAKRATTEEFVAAARDVHGDRYNYSQVVYQGRHIHVTIVCPDHGPFNQKPVYHTLRKAGCPLCANMVVCRDTFDDFVVKSRTTHSDRYSYHCDQYVNASTKTTITCKVHGTFEQLPYAHVYGQGCPTCGSKPFSKKAITWLESIEQSQALEIQHANNDGEYLVPGTKYRVDGYCKATNTIYEFHGDFWHGNPSLYDRSEIHPIVLRPMGELYDRTIQREEVIKSLGYNIVTIWESEWNLQDAVNGSTT